MYVINVENLFGSGSNKITLISKLTFKLLDKERLNITKLD